MFLNKIRRQPRALAMRLTIWYALIFATSSTLVFAFVYFLISTIVAQRTDAELQEDLAEFADFFQKDGVERVKLEMGLDAKQEEAKQVFLRLWTADGRQLAATDLSAWGGLGAIPVDVLRQANARGAIVETVNLSAREQGTRRIIGALGPGVVLEIGLSLEDDEELIATISRGFLATLAAVFVLGGPVGWFMAHRALRAIDKLTRTANEIALGALDRRVPIDFQGDELDHLAQTFNTMLDRIQALILGMREMTDNLAHDLRSPLARIRTAAEMSLSADERKIEHGALAIDVIEECDRLLEIINTTLDIAEAESGAAKLKISDVDLVAVVLDACDLFQTVAEDKQVIVTTELPPACLVAGDRQRLQRAFANLLDNALKYTPAAGRVAISLSADASTVRLAVTDTGIGISAEEQSRIFERFYRCDRSRGQGGNGLGLSLALAIVRAHGGDIVVESALGQGSRFTITLARAPLARARDTQGHAPHVQGAPN